MSKFYIYNTDGERIGLLQHEDGVQWMENYQSPGEVKIDARATPENCEMLVDGNRIFNADTNTVARICHVDLLQSETESVLTVRANLTSELLSDRVLMATERVANVEAAMYGIYSKNRRGLPIFAGDVQGYTEQVDMEITWGSVLEAEQKLAEISGLGFSVIFDPESGAETFRVYKGVDRSDEQSPGYVGYFGTDVGNIQDISVTTGTTDYKNVAVVAGGGEGADREVRVVSLGNVSGENRRELYVDARDLQRKYQVAAPTGEVDDEGNPIYHYEIRNYSDKEYYAMLDARGRKKLSEHLRSFSITCTIVQNNMFYGVDYFLGDRMPVKLLEYGIYASARITSVTMVYEQSGDKIIALLSDFVLEEEL